MLVTDGAAGVRGEPIDAGLERLRVLSEQEPDARRLCECDLGAARGRAARATTTSRCSSPTYFGALPSGSLTRWPADAEALRGLRHLLRRWLMGHGASADEAYDITVAVQEAAANAVEHAYAPGVAAFTVEAEHRDGMITVVITDRGSWREARGKNRGRGLPLMRVLMRASRCAAPRAGRRSSCGGRSREGRREHGRTGARGAPRAGRRWRWSRARWTRRDVGEVAVKLRRIVENQLHRVVIDLTGASYLDSAWINLLFSVGGDVRAREQELHLVVGPSSPIERMLEIVGADRAFPMT